MVSRRYAWIVVIVAMLTMAVSYIDRATLAVLAPTVTKELGISEVNYGWLTSIFSVAYLVATPVSGWWLDRVGARRGLIGSVAVWSGVAALHALVPGFGALVVLRIALGLAEGPGFPGAAQTVQRVLPVVDQPRGFGMLFMGSSIGIMIAPPLVTLLFENFGWRIAFLGTSIVGLAWIPAWLFVTRLPEIRARMDAATAAAEDAPPPPTVAELLRDPTIRRGLLGVLAAAPAVGFFTYWGAKYLVKVFAFKQADVGAYLWQPPIGLDLGAFGVGWLAAMHRRRTHTPPRLLFAIATLLAASIALFPLATEPWQAVVLACAASAGGGAINTLITSDTLAQIAPNRSALAGGVLACAQSVALIIVNPLIGLAVQTYDNYDVATIALGAWVLPGTLFWLLWPRPGRPTNLPRAVATQI